VAAGLLEPRQEFLISLRLWLEEHLCDEVSPDQRSIIEEFANDLIASSVDRVDGDDLSEMTAISIRYWVREAWRFTAFVSQQGLVLSDVDARVVDAWVAARPRNELWHPFLRWCLKTGRIEKRLTIWKRKRIEQTPWVKLSEEKWRGWIDWLLGDESVDLRDRVAGLLLLMYAFRPGELVGLRRTSVREDAERVWVQRGQRWLRLEPRAGKLAIRLRDAASTPPSASHALFPSATMFQPLGPNGVVKRLKRLGIDYVAGRARSRQYWGHRLVPAAIQVQLAVSSRLACVIWAQANPLHTPVRVRRKRSRRSRWTA
jgi:integrase